MADTVRTTSWKTLVVQANPNHYAEQRKVEEYRFSNDRVFTANPTTRGAYGEDD
jgi:hypothetical protein